ncbi:MAG TPA: hypothetical protein VGF92_16240 [Stellaceae bacterium]
MALAATIVAGSAVAHAQINSTGGGGALGGGNAGAIGGGGAGMIGGPAAHAGTRGTGVITLHNQPHNPASPPPAGAGYGTPGNTGNLGPTSNSGVGTGVENDVRTGIVTSPNMR